MKRFLVLVTILISSFLAANFLIRHVSAQEIQEGPPEVNVYVFWSTGCPHCAKEKEYLAELAKSKTNLVILDFEVSKSFSSAVLFSEIGKYLDADTRGVPFTVIGSQNFIGFGSASTTGKEFIEAIEKVESGEDYDILEEFFDEFEKEEEQKQLEKDNKESLIEKIKNIGEEEEVIEEDEVEGEQTESEKKDQDIDLGIFGVVNTQEFSLPALTFIIALVDGFNPCAMWVLVFLISLLLGFKDKKRMWILGLTFIAASAFVYFLFMAAWLKFFLFFGFIIWIRIAVGLVALYFAYRNIKSFIENKDGGCEVTKDEKRINTLQKIKDITKKENLLPAMGGIILLAFAVNLIEALCSAGLPAIYTQILTMNELPTWKYYSYIVFYQLIFMLDDMAIFVIAMLTMHSVGIESKYARFSKIVGGVVMLIIGLLLIFKPEFLLFG